MELIEVYAEFIRNNPAEGMGVSALILMAVCWVTKDWVI